MCSYSAITLTDHLDRSNNTPACANPYLLESITRGELGLHGYILSDAGAAAFTAEVEISPSAGHWHATNRTFGHGFAKSPADAAIKCIEAGLDLELTCCGAPEVYPTLVQSIVSGKISVELVDRALRRTLPFRFELGAMDPLDVQARNPYNRLDARNVSAPWMLGLARRAAERAIVLLKNTPIARAVVDATVLPLSEGNLKDKVVCVIGPNANDTVAQMGGYVNQHPLYVSTPFVAMATRLTNVAREVRLLVGCSNYTACPHFDLPSIAECELSVVVLGLTNDARSKEENGDACGCPYGDAIEGECCDRQDVQLPGKQAELLDTVVSATAGRPVILVSINAGMLDLTAAKANPGVHSILNAAYLGMESGIALVNTLFGDANPAGRLPLTYVISTAHLRLVQMDCAFPLSSLQGSPKLSYHLPFWNVADTTQT
jgi:beta-glucosidase